MPPSGAKLSRKDTPRLRVSALVLRSGDCLWFEFEADGLWTLPLDVTLRWDDGTGFTADVEAHLSTRPGAVAAGSRIRLCLRIPTGAPVATPITLDLDGTAFTVVEQP